MLHAEIIVLSATDFPPYEFENPKDGLRGFDVEVVEAAFQRVQIASEFVFLPWKRALEKTKLGMFTGIFSCSHRPDREEHFIFSDMISSSTHGFIVRQDFDGFEPSSLQEAKGLKVGSVLGWVQSDIMKEAGANVITYRSDELAFRALMKSVIDYTYLPLEASKFKAMQLGISKDMRFTNIYENKLYICFSKKSPNVEEVARKFNEGLAAIRADGSYKKIHDKYR